VLTELEPFVNRSITVTLANVIEFRCSFCEGMVMVSERSLDRHPRSNMPVLQLPVFGEKDGRHVHFYLNEPSIVCEVCQEPIFLPSRSSNLAIDSHVARVSLILSRCADVGIRKITENSEVSDDGSNPIMLVRRVAFSSTSSESFPGILDSARRTSSKVGSALVKRVHAGEILMTSNSRLQWAGSR